MNNSCDQPAYGASPNYTEGGALAYFEYQSANSSLQGRLKSKWFQDYIAETDSVLDFGCGGGSILAAIKCRERVGVEINPHARVVAESLGIKCHNTIATIPAASIDVCISNHALEHVPFPIQALRELRSTLRPGGQMLLMLPLDDWRNQRSFMPADHNHHLHTWTPQLLGNTLLEAGFSLKEASVQIIAHAWMPHYPQLYRFTPEIVFNFFCQLYAIAVRRRQIFVRVKLI
jgi:SAM-dependent methyltransferase